MKFGVLYVFIMYDIVKVCVISDDIVVLYVGWCVEMGSCDVLCVLFYYLYLYLLVLFVLELCVGWFDDVVECCYCLLVLIGECEYEVELCLFLLCCVMCVDGVCNCMVLLLCIFGNGV